MKIGAIGGGGGGGGGGRRGGGVLFHVGGRKGGFKFQIKNVKMKFY